MNSSEKILNHTDRDHAPLAPSSAVRWNNCLPSLLYQDERMPGAAAVEGTMLHEKLEAALTWDDESWQQGLSDEQRNAIEEIQAYLHDHVIHPDTIVYLEHKVSFNQYLEGTADVIALNPPYLDIADAKFGKNWEVKAENNLQLALYAFMARLNFRDMEEPLTKIRMHIMQPFRNNFDLWEVSLLELSRFVQSCITTAENLAKHGEKYIALQEKVAGEHCRFCPGLAICDTHREYQKNKFLPVIGKIDDPPTKKELTAVVAGASDEQLIDIFKNKELFKAFINAIEKELFTRSQTRKLDGLKLVRGRANRKWIDNTEKVRQALLKLGVKEPMKWALRGITDIEKEIGKGKVNTLTVKPEGKLMLVEDTDKREKVSPKEDMLKSIPLIGEDNE